MPNSTSDPAGETSIGHLHALSGRYHFVYLFLMTLVIGTICSLPFIQMDITVTSSGTIRPGSERTELKTAISGQISQVLVKEGQSILKNELILKLNDEAIVSRKKLVQFELERLWTHSRDLQAMIGGRILESSNHIKLNSPLSKQELDVFLSRLLEIKNQIRKSEYELEISEKLYKEKIIAAKEHFEVKNANDQLLASLQSLKFNYRSQWQQMLQQAGVEIREKENEIRQLDHELEKYKIRAPVAGAVQFINHRYPGITLAAGESVCVISPDDELVAENYINPRELGMIRRGQPCIFQIDAFNYNIFGVLTGKVISIDPDYTLIDNQPFIKVRCSFDRSSLELPNGFTGNLTKGMSLSTRFIVAKRSLWQLLYDQLDDWLNPHSPL